jgi:hypothetical protein
MLGFSWVYSSENSPYTFVPTMEKPAGENYTYLVAKFQNFEGIVNADEPDHSEMLTMFTSGRVTRHLFYFQRPLIKYWISQFTYVWNSYHVWIVANIACWLLMIFLTLRICNNYGFTKKAKILVACATSCAPIYLGYVSQSSEYLITFFSLLIMLSISNYIEKDKISTLRKRLQYILLFSAVSLSYDSHPWIIGFLIYLVLTFKMRKTEVAFILIPVYIIYFAYRVIIPFLLDLHPVSNSSYIDTGARTIVGKLINGEILILYSNVVDSFTNYVGLLTNLIGVVIFSAIVLNLLTYNSQAKEKSNSVDILISLDKRIELVYFIKIFLVIGFLLQIFWTSANLTEVGLIPRVNANLLTPLILLLGLVVSQNEKRGNIFVVNLTLYVIPIYFLLILQNYFPLNRFLFFNLIEGKWRAFNFG